MAQYTVDFLCLDAKLIVEVDGAQHDWQTDYDVKRTQELEAMGFRLLRFHNQDVRDHLDEVLETIGAALRP